MGTKDIINEYLSEEFFLKLVDEDRDFIEILKEVMELGKVIVDTIGHKDYMSEEDFFKDITDGTSPIFQIDPSSLKAFELFVNSKLKITALDNKSVLMIVQNCPIKEKMKQMLTESNEKIKRKTFMRDIQVNQERLDKFLIGSYVLLQIRQMLVSSLSINGEYRMNIENLVFQTLEKTDKGVKSKPIIFESALKKVAGNSNFNTNKLRNSINKIIKEHNEDVCIYSIYLIDDKENQKNKG